MGGIPRLKLEMHNQQILRHARTTTIDAKRIQEEWTLDTRTSYISYTLLNKGVWNARENKDAMSQTDYQLSESTP